MSELWGCRLMTLQEMFEDMNRAKEEPGRQPIILLLGGGMAAGKSTVREIIGKDGFWSKVSFLSSMIEVFALLCLPAIKGVKGEGSEENCDPFFTWESCAAQISARRNLPLELI